MTCSSNWCYACLIYLFLSFVCASLSFPTNSSELASVRNVTLGSSLNRYFSDVCMFSASDVGGADQILHDFISDPSS